MSIVIEKGVVQPPYRSPGGGGRPKYPWDDLEVGDSFAVPVKAGDLLQAYRSIQVSGHYALVRRGKKFRVVEMAPGLRVWRTA